MQMTGARRQQYKEITLNQHENFSGVYCQTFHWPKSQIWPVYRPILKILIGLL